MDAKYYCSTVTSDLVGLKARLCDIITALEKSPKRGQLSTELTSLHALMHDLQTKIDKLNMESPVDWSAAKREIDKARQELVEKINIWDSQHIAGGWVGG